MVCIQLPFVSTTSINGGRTRSMDPFDARYTPIPIFLFFILFHSNLFLSVYFLSLSHHPPSIESFHGKISNVLARFSVPFYSMSIFSTRYSFSLRRSLFFFFSLFSCLCPSRGQKENVISPACVISTTLWAPASKRDRWFFSPPSPTFTNPAFSFSLSLSSTLSTLLSIFSLPSSFFPF